MKKLGLILLISTLYTSNIAIAQKWSVEQQEVIDHLQACWDAFNAKVFDNWVEVCRPADNQLFWETSKGLPQTVGFLRKALEAQWQTSDGELLWVDIRPLDVQLHGDVALLYNYTMTSWINDGKVGTSEEKRLEVFRKVAGQWTIIGGITVPVD